jgi:alpha-1,2-mannosyltransferase
MRKAYVALLLILFPCILPRIKRAFPTGDLVDFGPYYTAAVLAGEHRGVGIYSGADTGKDPQNVLADKSTLFAQTASRVGVHRPFLYLYPPILADMLIPLAHYSFVTAGDIWTIFNYASLPLVALCIVGILKLRWSSWGSLIVLVAVFSYSPVLQSIAMGQVSVLLLLIWACGTFYYTKGWHGASGFAFALATAIKLTPLIVVIPLLLLKEWKVLRGFIVSLTFLAVLICLINTPSSLVDYFGHVVPPMSRGILLITNVSISASIERLFLAFNHKAIAPSTADHISPILILLGKISAAAILGAVCVLTFKKRNEMKVSDRAMTLALFAMLSACIAPVSWQHGYSICLLALCLLWAQAVREPITNLRLMTLFLCTLALTTYLNNIVIASIVRGNAAHPILDSIAMLLVPVAGIVLVLAEFAVMKSPNRQKLPDGRIAFDKSPVILI